MSVHDNTCFDPLFRWVVSSDETQLRFMTYGLLVAIQRALEKLPKTKENEEAVASLIYGLSFAACAKDNCDPGKSCGEWLSTPLNSSALQEIALLLSLDQKDMK